MAGNLFFQFEQDVLDCAAVTITFKALNNHQPNFLNNYNSLHNLPVMLYCYMKNRKNLLKILINEYSFNGGIKWTRACSNQEFI